MAHYHLNALYKTNSQIRILRNLDDRYYDDKEFTQRGIEGWQRLLARHSEGSMTAARRNMLRYFKKPTPAREISIVTLKAFTKIRLIDALKQTIMENLPDQIRRRKKAEIIRL